MKAFWKSVFCEPNGAGSWARVSSAITLVAVIVWVSYLVWKTQTLPPLSEAAVFVSGSYGLNKITGMIQKKFYPEDAPKEEENAPKPDETT